MSKLKLKKILKENLTWGSRKFGDRLPTLDDYQKAHTDKNIELGKVYTSKDNPPFKTPKQIEEEKLQEGEGLGWALDWESEIAQLINSRELKSSMKDKNSKVKTIAQRLKKNLIQVHIGFDGLKDELRKVYGEGKITEGKETIFDVAKKVLDDKQHQNYKSKKGMVKVDMQTANLLVKVWKKVNPKMKKILSDLGYNNPAGLMNTLWAVVK